MTTPLSVEIGSIGGVPVLRLHGALTFDAEIAAVRLAAEHLRDRGGRVLVLDLSGVQATDSTGVGTLVELHRTVGGRIVLLRPPDQLRNTLTITHVIEIFEVVDDDEALERWLVDRRGDDGTARGSGDDGSA